MIIYIPIEIPAREMQGYLLLAMFASARGHQIVLTSGVDLWMYKRLNLLKQGAYLLKNMNVPYASKKVYKGFIKSGFHLYCQEQEASIIYGNFQSYISTIGIKEDQFIPFKGIFCWGERDTAEFKLFFESIKDIFYQTGALRSDIWDLTKTIYPKIENEKPYFLIISNFSYVMSKDHWSKIYQKEYDLEMLETPELKSNFINKINHELAIVVEIIHAAKHLAVNYPEYEVIIRPHPSDLKENWENILSDYPNIKIIDNKDSISPWIANSKAIIQNGCTTAIEAVIQEVPIISYGPDRIYDDLSIPNKLGIRAYDLEELDRSIVSILNYSEYESIQIISENAIKPFITYGYMQSAKKIIKIMENDSKELDNQMLKNSDLIFIKLAKIIKLNLDRVRKLFKVGGLEIEEPVIDFDEAERILELLSADLDMPMPNIKKIHKSFSILS